MRTETFDALARLLTYPRADFHETLDAAIGGPGVVRASCPPLDDPASGVVRASCPPLDDPSSGVVRASCPPLNSESAETKAGGTPAPHEGKRFETRAGETPAPHGGKRFETRAGGTPAPHRGDALGPVETALTRFRDAVDGLPLHELEEAFTTTFDLDPVAALEVGWHLYGDTYERGRFLVEMRQRLHRLGMTENGELPDHLATVLRVLPRLDAAEAEGLARGAVMPALQKMLEPLRSRESLYLPLLQSIDALLAAELAPAVSISDQEVSA